ncbi:hypothetical protein P9112_013864 [Eukaryota sp. TZLM1-RC]
MVPKEDVLKFIDYYIDYFDNKLHEDQGLEFKDYFPVQSSQSNANIEFVKAVCAMHNSGTEFKGLSFSRSVFIVVYWPDPCDNDPPLSSVLRDYKAKATSLKFSHSTLSAHELFSTCFGHAVNFNLHPLMKWTDPDGNTRIVTLMEIPIQQSPLQVVSANSKYRDSRGIWLRCGDRNSLLSRVHIASNFYQIFSQRFPRSLAQSFKEMSLLFNSTEIFSDNPYRLYFLWNLLSLPFLSFLDLSETSVIDLLKMENFPTSEINLKAIYFEQINLDEVASFKNRYIYKVSTIHLPEIIGKFREGMSAECIGFPNNLLPLEPLSNSRCNSNNNDEFSSLSSFQIFDFVTREESSGRRFRFFHPVLSESFTRFPVSDVPRDQRADYVSFLKGCKPKLELFSAQCLIPIHSGVENLCDILKQSYHDPCTKLTVHSKEPFSGARTAILLSILELSKHNEDCAAFVYSGSKYGKLNNYFRSLGDILAPTTHVVYLYCPELDDESWNKVDQFCKSSQYPFKNPVSLVFIRLVLNTFKTVSRKRNNRKFRYVDYVSPSQSELCSSKFERALNILLQHVRIETDLTNYSNIKGHGIHFPDFLYLGLHIFQEGFSNAPTIIEKLVKSVQTPLYRALLHCICTLHVITSINRKNVVVLLLCPDANVKLFQRFLDVQQDGTINMNLSVAKIFCVVFIQMKSSYLESINLLLKTYPDVKKEIFINMLAEVYANESVLINNIGRSIKSQSFLQSSSDITWRFINEHWDSLVSIVQAQPSSVLYHLMLKLLKNVYVNQSNYKSIKSKVVVVEEGNVMSTDVVFSVALADMFRYLSSKTFHSLDKFEDLENALKYYSNAVTSLPKNEKTITYHASVNYLKALIYVLEFPYQQPSTSTLIDWCLDFVGSNSSKFSFEVFEQLGVEEKDFLRRLNSFFSDDWPQFCVDYTRLCLLLKFLHDNSVEKLLEAFAHCNDNYELLKTCCDTILAHDFFELSSKQQITVTALQAIVSFNDVAPSPNRLDVFWESQVGDDLSELPLWITNLCVFVKCHKRPNEIDGNSVDVNKEPSFGLLYRENSFELISPETDLLDEPFCLIYTGAAVFQKTYTGQEVDWKCITHDILDG